MLDVYGRVFPVLWSIALLFDRSVRGATLDVPSAGITLAALIVLLRPSSPLRLVLLAFAHLGWLAWIAPRMLHVHWYLDGVINLAIVAAFVHAVVRQKSLRISMDQLARGLVPSGRAILLVALFFAGFAKLNTSFLDPRYSCAAALYDFQRELFPYSLLPDAPWAKQAAIVLAVCAELGVPLLLLVRGLRLPAVVFACGFFLLIGTNPQNKLYEFTAAFLSLLIFFVPEALLEDAARSARWASLRERLASTPLRKVLGWSLLLLLTLYLTVVADRDELAGAERDAFARLFYAASLVFGVALLVHARLKQAYPEPPTGALLTMSPSLAVIPLLFALHESTVYLGLKHMPTLTMAANLRIERGLSNHVVVQEVPHLEANRAVRLLGSSDHRLHRIGEGVTWMGLQHYLASHRKASVRFELDGKREYVKRAGKDPRFKRSSWIAGVLTRGDAKRPHGRPWLFSLRNGPKRCHHQVAHYRREEPRRRRRLAAACEKHLRPMCAWFALSEVLEGSEPPVAAPLRRAERPGNAPSAPDEDD